MPQARQLVGQGHSHTHQQAGYLKTLWAHSHPGAHPCPPEDQDPASQCEGTSPGTPRRLQPENPGPSLSTSRLTPTLRYFGLSQLTQDPTPLIIRLTPTLAHPGTHSQPCQEPAPPTRRPTLDLGTLAMQPPTSEPGSAHQWARTSPGSMRFL